MRERGEKKGDGPRKGAQLEGRALPPAWGPEQSPAHCWPLSVPTRPGQGWRLWFGSSPSLTLRNDKQDPPYPGAPGKPLPPPPVHPFTKRNHWHLAQCWSPRACKAKGCACASQTATSVGKPGWGAWELRRGTPIKLGVQEGRLEQEACRSLCRHTPFSSRFSTWSRGRSSHSRKKRNCRSCPHRPPTMIWGPPPPTAPQ